MALVNLSHYGLVLSSIPPSSLRDLIWVKGLRPTSLQTMPGIRDDVRYYTGTVTFDLVRGTKYEKFTAKWDTQTHEVEYFRDQGKSKFLCMDELNWYMTIMSLYPVRASVREGNLHPKLRYGTTYLESLPKICGLES